MAQTQCVYQVQYVYQEYPEKWWQRALIGYGLNILFFFGIVLSFFFGFVILLLLPSFLSRDLTFLCAMLGMIGLVIFSAYLKVWLIHTFGRVVESKRKVIVAFPSDLASPLVIGKALWVWKKGYDRFVEIDVENLDEHIPKEIYWTLKVSALNGLVQARIPITLIVRLKESSRLINPLEVIALLAYFPDCSYVRHVFKCDLESICSDSGFLKGTGVSIERFFANTTAMSALDVRTWILGWIKQNVEKFVFSSIVNMEVSVGDPQIVVTSSIS
ncbi:MAG: hypothetical protein KBC26_03435 [Candidatus Pacebacteria bacterium]|nr:hypothetical protein [Candidatus Paceibacterota bacterium]